MGNSELVEKQGDFKYSSDICVCLNVSRPNGQMAEWTKGSLIAHIRQPASMPTE